MPTDAITATMQLVCQTFIARSRPMASVRMLFACSCGPWVSILRRILRFKCGEGEQDSASPQSRILPRRRSDCLVASPSQSQSVWRQRARLACPGRGAARSDAPQSRDPGAAGLADEWAPALQRITPDDASHRRRCCAASGARGAKRNQSRIFHGHGRAPTSRALGLAQLRRRRAKALAEGAVEIGEIGEA